MRVRKLVVGKSKTVRRMQGWITEYYEVELDILNESEVNKARKRTLARIDKWLGEKEIVLIEGKPFQPREADFEQHGKEVKG